MMNYVIKMTVSNKQKLISLKFTTGQELKVFIIRNMSKKCFHPEFKLFLRKKFLYFIDIPITT